MPEDRWDCDLEGIDAFKKLVQKFTQEEIDLLTLATEMSHDQTALDDPLYQVLAVTSWRSAPPWVTEQCMQAAFLVVLGIGYDLGTAVAAARRVREPD